MKDYSKYYIKKYVDDMVFNFLNIPKNNKECFPELGELILCDEDVYKVKSICVYDTVNDAHIYLELDMCLFVKSMLNNCNDVNDFIEKI